MNGRHLSKKLEIFEATGESTEHIKVFLSSLSTIPPTSIYRIRACMLNTVQLSQYCLSLFPKIILEKCLIS